MKHTTQGHATDIIEDLARKAKAMSSAWAIGNVGSVKNYVKSLREDLGYIEEEIKRQLYANLK